MTLAEKERIFVDGKLETDESFALMETLIRQETERVTHDQDLARNYLYKTGMYERDGRLKPEFASS